MVRRNIAGLKLLGKNLISVRCYDETNMKVFALSLWEKQLGLNLFWPVYDTVCENVISF